MYEWRIVQTSVKMFQMSSLADVCIIGTLKIPTKVKQGFDSIFLSAFFNHVK